MTDLDISLGDNSILGGGGDNTFITKSELTSILVDYAKSTDLSDFVTNSALTAKLGSYVTTSTLTSRLSSYVTSSSLTSKLSNYLNKTSSSDLYAVFGKFAPNFAKAVLVPVPSGGGLVRLGLYKLLAG